MLLISINNGTDQGVTHDIPVGKITHGDAGHGLEGLQGLDQAGAFIRRKIDLGDVPGDDALGIHADACEQHEHLLGGSILRLIENDKGIVQGATAHIGKRRHFDDFAGKCALQFPASIMSCKAS